MSVTNIGSQTPYRNFCRVPIRVEGLDSWKTHHIKRQIRFEMQNLRQEHRSFMNLFGVPPDLLGDILFPTHTPRDEPNIEAANCIHTFPKMTRRDLDAPRTHHRHAHTNLCLSVSEWIVFRSHRV